MQGPQVQPLAGDLRSHMLHGTAKRLKQTKKKDVSRGSAHLKAWLRLWNQLPRWLTHMLGWYWLLTGGLNSSSLYVVQSLSSIWLFATPPGLQHTRLPCPSPTPRACSNSHLLSQWCHPTILSSIVPFSCLQSFPASGSFPRSQLFASDGQSIGALVSISPSNKYLGLISFRIDWFHLFAVQGTLKILFQYHSSKTSILWHSAFFMVQLSHPYMLLGKP